MKPVVYASHAKASTSGRHVCYYLLSLSIFLIFNPCNANKLIQSFSVYAFIYKVSDADN